MFRKLFQFWFLVFNKCVGFHLEKHWRFLLQHKRKGNASLCLTMKMQNSKNGKESLLCKSDNKWTIWQIAPSITWCIHHLIKKLTPILTRLSYSYANLSLKRLRMYRTQCQDEFRSLSGSVTEILTACRMHQILIAWCQIEAEIRGLPTMYIMVGGKYGPNLAKNTISSRFKASKHQFQWTEILNIWLRRGL